MPPRDMAQDHLVAGGWAPLISLHVRAVPLELGTWMVLTAVAAAKGGVCSLPLLTCAGGPHAHQHALATPQQEADLLLPQCLLHGCQPLEAERVRQMHPSLLYAPSRTLKS